MTNRRLHAFHRRHFQLESTKSSTSRPKPQLNERIVTQVFLNGCLTRECAECLFERRTGDVTPHTSVVADVSTRIVQRRRRLRSSARDWKRHVSLADRLRHPRIDRRGAAPVVL